MVVVLNQADRLPDADVTRCLTDLRRLLAADGLGSVPLLATSATSPRPGILELRGSLDTPSRNGSRHCVASAPTWTERSTI